MQEFRPPISALDTFVRRHKRTNIGGPIGMLCIAPLIPCVAYFLVNTWWFLATLIFPAIAVYELVTEIRRWGDYISLTRTTLTVRQFGRVHEFHFEDLPWLEFGERSRAGCLVILLPIYLFLLVPLLGTQFTFRVRSPDSSDRRAVVTIRGVSSRSDPIHGIANWSIHAIAQHMTARVRNGEVVLWTPRLILMPEGVALLKRRYRPGRELKIKRLIAYENIRSFEARHGHLLIGVIGKKRYALNHIISRKGCWPGLQSLRQLVDPQV